MKWSAFRLGTAALFLFVGSGVVRAQEEKVPLDQIPIKVMDALLSKFAKAKVQRCTKAKEAGAIVYDIEVRQANGKKAEADIKEDGTFITFEKEIEAKDLPKAVRDAIDKRYPKSTLKEIMEETAVDGKKEKISAYEVTIVTAENRRVEVHVSPDGKILEDTGEKEKEKN